MPVSDSCQKKFPWNHKENGLALHPVVGLALQVGLLRRRGEVSSGTWFRKPGSFLLLLLFLFFSSASRVHFFTATEEDGLTRDLYNINLPAKLMVLRLRHILFNPTIAAIAGSV